MPGYPEFRRQLVRDGNPARGREKTRWAYIPNNAMRALHARLLAYLRELDGIPYAKGAWPSLRARDGAELHRGNRFFFSVEVGSAFEAVEGKELARIFCDSNPYLGDPAEVHGFLTHFFLDPRGGLVPDAPASLELLNLYLAMCIDERLGEYASRRGILYSRRWRGLTFSSRRQIGRRSTRMIRAIIVSEGFRVDRGMFRTRDIRKTPVPIAGLELCSGGRIKVPESSPTRKRVRAATERAVRRSHLPNLEPQVAEGSVWATRHPSWGETVQERKVVESYEESRRIRVFDSP